MKKPPSGDSAHKRSTAIKRHCTTVTYLGINYIDGDMRTARRTSAYEDSYSAWSVKHDNRLVQNDETITKKVVTPTRRPTTRSRPSPRWTLCKGSQATAQGEIAGIGGSVTSTTEARAHS